MNFLQIPGFGVFNKPLPELIDHCADTAVGWIKNQVTQKKTDTPPVEAQEQKVTEDAVLPHDVNADLVINLASPHSVVLEQSLKEIVIPDTSGDEALARKLAAQEEAKPPVAPRPVLKEAAKPIQERKVEEKKKESSVFSTNQASKKVAKDHHSHHRTHHKHKK